MIAERKIVARELAGAADPDHEEREGFFPYREMADQVVTALERARGGAAAQNLCDNPATDNGESIGYVAKGRAGTTPSDHTLIEKLDEIIILSDPEEMKTNSQRCTIERKVWELARSLKHDLKQREILDKGKALTDAAVNNALEWFEKIAAEYTGFGMSSARLQPAVLRNALKREIICDICNEPLSRYGCGANGTCEKPIHLEPTKRESIAVPSFWVNAAEKLPPIDVVVSGAVKGFKYPIPVSVAYLRDDKAYWRVWPSTEQFMPNLLTADCVTHWCGIGNKPEIEVQEGS